MDHSKLAETKKQCQRFKKKELNKNPCWLGALRLKGNSRF